MTIWPKTPLTNDQIVIRTLSVILVMVMVTLCVGLFSDKVDNKQIFEILGGFFNSGLLVYLGVVKVGSAAKKDDPSGNSDNG